MNRNKKTLVLILILLILCTGISVSYAYFKVSNSSSGKAVVTVNGAPLCMTLQLKVNNISIKDAYAVPVSDAKALSSTVYKTTLTVENKCTSAQSFKLLTVPGPNNTMPIEAIKYALVENGATVPSTGQLLSDFYVLDSTIKKQLSQMLNNTSYKFNTGYFTGTGTVAAGTTKTYNLYLWIDENEGGLGNNVTMGKTLSTYLALATGNTIGEEIVATNNLYKTIENRYKLGNSYVKKYGDLSGEDGASTYANPVYYFNGAVEDNNVLFAGFCWKIVRTTDTGGVKMIYNGAYNEVPTFTTLDSSSLKRGTTIDFSFNDTDKIWYSENSGRNTASTISFSLIVSGDYYIDFNVSTDQGDFAYFYKNNEVIAQYDGQENGKIELKNLLPSDTIKVEYVILGNSPSGKGNVTFSVLKPTDKIISCNNTGTASQLASKKAFNSSSNSPAYVGYMHNTVYTYSSRSMSSQSNIVFGNNFTYANRTYTLSNTKTVATWSSGYNTINSNHYTCFTTGTTCTSLYYVYYTNSSAAYYITLTNGKSVEDALNEMLYADGVNKTDSTIKAYIDSWYKDNMTSYTDKLEDTVFCNDRTILNKNGWNPNGGSTSTYLEFKNDSTNYSLACANETDRFSVNNSKARLNYPVGLLSTPEVWLAYRGASSSTYYLKTGNDYWLASAGRFDYDDAVGVRVIIGGGVNYATVYYAMGVRPVVSLKPGTEYTSGNGAYTNPFVVE